MFKFPSSEFSIVPHIQYPSIFHVFCQPILHWKYIQAASLLFWNIPCSQFSFSFFVSVSALMKTFSSIQCRKYSAVWDGKPALSKTHSSKHYISTSAISPTPDHFCYSQSPTSTNLFIKAYTYYNQLQSKMHYLLCRDKTRKQGSPWIIKLLICALETPYPRGQGSSGVTGTRAVSQGHQQCCHVKVLDPRNKHIK